MTDSGRYSLWQKKSKPIVDAFFEWVKSEQGKLLVTKSLLGTALTYAINQEEKLRRFLEDGRIEISNNRAERSIKPFVMGRKNRLFCNTPRGARSSAILYSIIETAKENALKPYDYLKWLFEKTAEGVHMTKELVPYSTHLHKNLKM